jgi:hypothetical protein
MVCNIHVYIFQISNRLETFQDLSLPIPSREQLLVIHQSVPQTQSQGEDQVKHCENESYSTSRDEFVDILLYRAGCLGCGITFGVGSGDQMVV